jgi:hypothetical protein
MAQLAAPLLKSAGGSGYNRTSIYPIRVRDDFLGLNAVKLIKLQRDKRARGNSHLESEN